MLEPPVNETSRLNLPPLKADSEGKIDAAQINHFARTLDEWGKRVDRMIEDLTARIEELEP